MTTGAALDGVVVVDLTRRESGAAAGFALAQFGATVIAVEPVTGLALREEAQALPRGEALWTAWHANKKSFAVNLDAPAGRELVCALVQKADILIEDSEAEVLQLGLDYGRARILKPSLVYGTLRPWVSAERFNGLASETMLQAVTGFVARTGDPDSRPLRIHTRNVAGMSGMYLATGVMAAFLDVETRGGQHVRVTEEEIGMYPEAAKYREGTDFEKRTRFGDNGEWVGAVPSRTFATKPFGPNDYVYVHVNAKVTSHQVALARAIERPDLLTDPDFATPELRRKNVEKVADIVSEWMARHTKQEAVAILGKAGVPVGMVNTSEEVLGLDHVLASGMICPVETPDGPVPVPALPVRLSASNVPLRRGPRLGEHTAEVLGLIGRDREAATLRGEGLVR